MVRAAIYLPTTLPTIFRWTGRDTGEPTRTNDPLISGFLVPPVHYPRRWWILDWRTPHPPQMRHTTPGAARSIRPWVGSGASAPKRALRVVAGGVQPRGPSPASLCRFPRSRAACRGPRFASSHCPSPPHVQVAGPRAAARTGFEGMPEVDAQVHDVLAVADDHLPGRTGVLRSRSQAASRNTRGDVPVSGHFVSRHLHRIADQGRAATLQITSLPITMSRVAFCLQGAAACSAHGRSSLMRA
jgi:hypothetical protein